MGLSTSFKSEPKKSSDFMSGVFVNECTIVSVKPVYGGKEWQNEKYKDDVGLDITIDIGKSFQPVFYVGGRLKRDEFGEVKDLGTVRRIATFFDAIDVDAKLTDEHKIEEDVLPDCVGQMFNRLSYVSGTKQDGKVRYSDFQEVVSANTPSITLIETFKKHVNNGWLKNYKPELMDNSSDTNDIPGGW
jgi:hypothetical protein